MRHRNGQRDTAWRLLWESLSSLGGRYCIFLIALVGFALVSLLPPQFLKFFTSEVLRDHAPVETLLTFGFLVAAALWISRAGSALCQEWLRVTLESSLRQRVLTALHGTALVRLEAAQRGDWYSRVTSDLGRVEMFLADTVPAQLRILTILLGAGGLFVYHSGPVALLPLGMAITLAGLNFYFHGRLSARLREMRELHAGVLQELVENFEGIRTIRSHRAEPFVQSRFQRQLQHLKQRSLGVVRVVGGLLGTNELVTQALITLCLAAVTVGLKGGALTLDEALLYPFYLGMFCSAAGDLARSAYDWNRFFTEGHRVGEFLFASDRREEKRFNLAYPDEVTARDLGIGFGSSLLRPPFHFQLKRGELVLLTGPSGCGKSTFLEVLAGLRPALSGTLETSLDWFAYVEQRPYLFEGTLRDNLTLGLTRSDTALWEDLQSASIADFFRAKDGLDFRVSDRGENLSEGQRYRIALARAFSLRRPFLLLDEPFAAIDPRSVAAVIHALEVKRAEGVGIVLVSHQIPEALLADRVMDFLPKENLEAFLDQTGADGARAVRSPVFN